MQTGFRTFLHLGKELVQALHRVRYPDFYPVGPPYKFYTEEVGRRCASYAGSILQEVKRYLTA